MPDHLIGRAAKVLESRLLGLARISDERGRLTRTFLSPAMRRTNRQVGAWMREAGLHVREDDVGNLVGRTGGRAGQTFLLGSHLDTVRNAGRFDGALGVLLPICALGVLRARGVKLPFAVEVIGFSEEEGVRFSSGYLGSKGFLGRLTKRDLSLLDADGVSVADSLRRARLSPHRKLPRRILGYLEAHIEQGPVLEDEGLALGVVSVISGQTRARAVFSGRAGHAGTTPMRLRRDALAGASEFILAAEALARRTAGLVATVGCLDVSPGASNVIPGGAALTVDVRHPADARRRDAVRRLRRKGREIAKGRGLSFSMKVVQDGDTVACSGALSARLAASVRRQQGRSLSIPSGAGHDAVVVSQVAPVAMLFVRCRKGLSHHPDEHVSRADLRSALAATVDFLSSLRPGRP
jgi:allantoate deiminase